MTDDKGSNFGRFARIGLMDAYMQEVYQEKLSGIPLSAWQCFLALFSEDRTEEDLLRSLDRNFGRGSERKNTNDNRNDRGSSLTSC